MKLKYNRVINLDLEMIGDAFMDTMEDQLNDVIREIATTNAQEEYLEEHIPQIKQELFPIISRKLMCWRNNNNWRRNKSLKHLEKITLELNHTYS